MSKTTMQNLLDYTVKLQAKFAFKKKVTWKKKSNKQFTNNHMQLKKFINVHAFACLCPSAYASVSESASRYCTYSMFVYD